jgi:hypothetical protein
MLKTYGLLCCYLSRIHIGTVYQHPDVNNHSNIWSHAGKQKMERYTESRIPRETVLAIASMRAT